MEITIDTYFILNVILHERVNGHKRKASTIYKRYENEQNGSKRSANVQFVICTCWGILRTGLTTSLEKYFYSPDSRVFTSENCVCSYEGLCVMSYVDLINSTTSLHYFLNEYNALYW